jgi:hypothetical protein
VPHVHHRRGLAATSVLAGATALALAPAALQQTQDRAPDAVPSARPGVHHSPPAGPSVTHTLDVAGLHLTYAATAGRSGLVFEIGNVIGLPPDAQKVDVDVPARCGSRPSPRRESRPCTSAPSARRRSTV